MVWAMCGALKAFPIVSRAQADSSSWTEVITVNNVCPCLHGVWYFSLPGSFALILLEEIASASASFHNMLWSSLLLATEATYKSFHGKHWIDCKHSPQRWHTIKFSNYCWELYMVYMLWVYVNSVYRLSIVASIYNQLNQNPIKVFN